nr:SDR family oxidoreductase [uncultured Pseudomonas sp.]
MPKLTGKIAVVTGGSSGIGLASAKRFAEEGAHVFITGRRMSELEKARSVIGENATAIQVDVSDLNDLDRMYAIIGEQAGRVDILMLNAAYAEFVAIGQITDDHYRKTFDTNVKAVVFGLQSALPLLSNGSSVVITGSIAGSSGIANFSMYGATKAALRSFARAAVVDLKGKGIRVNVLAPGHTSTPALNRLIDAPTQHEISGTIPLGRLGTSDEISRAALFLASDDSAYITGIELQVDGGVNQI